MEDSGEEVPTAPIWVWVSLSLIAAVSFWCQATVTEERLVPALNVISDYYNIPDDIAGATLMAAGASSPELFSSIVSLFITHSSLGLGTIVGSEIFNQLIICAGAVYASKTGKLKLDRAIVTREVGFYALGIVLLYLALQDVEPVDDDETGTDHIFISFWEALMVFSGYILYVIVCANMQAIVAFFKTETGTTSERTKLMNVQVPSDMEFVTTRKNLSSEPAENWNAVEYFMSGGLDQSLANIDTSTTGRQDGGGSVRNWFNESIRQSSRLDSLVSLLKHEDRPSGVHSLHDMEANDYEKTLRCFLWQRSAFYNKARFGSHAWHLRWFDITPDLITSVPDRQDPEEHKMTYPRFKEQYIDEERLIIGIVNPNQRKRNITLMAPSREIFDRVVDMFEEYMKVSATVQDNAPEDELVNDDGTQKDADEHMDLIEFPSEGGNVEIFFFLFLFPLRFLMHYTLPDVRHLDAHGDPTRSVGHAFFSTFMCLVWLIVGSYAMVASLEGLAELMDIPDAVIGVTVSAAGTSLPNYVASKVAAENGFGNQAVSNAFGSNTFNIMVGLGLPWVLYTSFGTGFEPYHGLANEGITESIIILGIVLLVFVVLMFQTGFVLEKWHGVLFIVMYIAYLAFAIGQVYLGND